MQTNEVIGYRVRCEDGLFVHVEWLGGPGQWHHYLASQEPEPVSRPDAYRRLAGFIEQNPSNDMHYEVVPVYREYTPIEKAGSELGGLLESLCKRHGVELNMTRAQIDAQLSSELQAFVHGGPAGLIVGLPKPR